MGTFAETANFHYICLLPTNEKKSPFSVSIFIYIHIYVKEKRNLQKTATSICLLQAVNYIFFKYAAFFRKKRMENRIPVIFLNSFTICSFCKRKFVVCLFVDIVTNRIYLFAYGLNGLAPLFIWG
jgi:hypothetical protein